MSFTYKRLKTITLCIIAIMSAGAWMASAGMAAEYGTKKTNVTIRQISPVELSTARSNVRSQDVFDIVGTLNAIDGNLIVIGDRNLSLASNVNAAGIAKWSEVGAKLNEAGEVVAIEIVSDEPH